MTIGKENKFHIGIYGRGNVGKSSLINFLTNQQVAIVSDIKGTTTDPVKRSFEILGLGAVIFIDTAGVDDTGDLGQTRINRTIDTINTIDLALLVVNPSGEQFIGEYEQQLIYEFKKLDVPHIIVLNKSDLLTEQNGLKEPTSAPFVQVSTKDAIGKERLIELIKNSLQSHQNPTMLGGLITKGDIVLLITPIDNEAPKGRLILPQISAIRSALDNNAISIVLKESELAQFISASKIKPALAITDSQIFKLADELIAKDIPLTSFSILMAKMKGDFEAYVQGVYAISALKDGDRVLMLENCSHQTSCDDIGRVKIPAWIKNFTGKQLYFDITEGLDKLNRPVSNYALAIQCGGCMVTHKQLLNRLKPFIDANIPITNYGMAIAYTQGIFERAIEIFKPKT